MKYPTIRKQQNMSVSIPGLSGGVNLHDTLSGVDDHQLTAADNVWWHDGALRTRPGFQMIDISSSIVNLAPIQRIDQTETLVAKYSETENPETVQLNVLKLTGQNFEQVGKNGEPVEIRRTKMESKIPTIFGCHDAPGQKSRYLLFTEAGEILREDTEDKVPGGWVEAEPYAPLVMIRGKGELANLVGIEEEEKPYIKEIAGARGIFNEDFNMLTGKFRCSFAPDGESRTFDLPAEALTYNDGEITEVVITLTNGISTKDFTFQLDPANKRHDGFEWYVSDFKSLVESEYRYIPNYAATMDIAYAHLNCRVYYDKFPRVCIDFDICDNAISGTAADEYNVPLSRQERDTIMVTAWKDAKSSREKICKMRQCAWFGGLRSGIGDGTRLFVCGNPDYPNLLHWSDLNNPLYFPVGNYNHIGDSGQAITGFGKQGDLLLIFKEREIHAAQYVAGTSEDIEFAKKSGVAVNVYTAKFPITPIQMGVGCDCPYTIQLVDNRLVWATSDGKVYMLPTVNQYNERNVRELSRNIRAQLSQHNPEEMKAAFAGEYAGYYVLQLVDTMYLLDTQVSAFTNFNYYTKEDNAQKALPWYIWSFPQGFEMMQADPSGIILCAGNQIFSVGGEYDIRYDHDPYWQGPIYYSFTTKLFDFDRKDMKKAVEQLYIGVGDAPENTVRISYVTDAYTVEDAMVIHNTGEFGKDEPGYMVQHRLTPNVSRVGVFGVRFEGTGTIAIGNILLKMKMQGVVR